MSTLSSLDSSSSIKRPPLPHRCVLVNYSPVLTCQCHHNQSYQIVSLMEADEWIDLYNAIQDILEDSVIGIPGYVRTPFPQWIGREEWKLKPSHQNIKHFSLSSNMV